MSCGDFKNVREITASRGENSRNSPVKIISKKIIYTVHRLFKILEFVSLKLIMLFQVFQVNLKNCLHNSQAIVPSQPEFHYSIVPFLTTFSIDLKLMTAALLSYDLKHKIDLNCPALHKIFSFACIKCKQTYNLSLSLIYSLIP